MKKNSIMMLQTPYFFEFATFHFIWTVRDLDLLLVAVLLGHRLSFLVLWTPIQHGIPPRNTNNHPQ